MRITSVAPFGHYRKDSSEYIWSSKAFKASEASLAYRVVFLLLLANPNFLMNSSPWDFQIQKHSLLKVTENTSGDMDIINNF